MKNCGVKVTSITLLLSPRMFSHSEGWQVDPAREEGARREMIVTL